MKKTVLIFLSLLILFLVSVTNIIAQNWQIDFVRKVNPNYPHSNFWIATTNSAKVISIATPVTMLAVGFISHNKELQTNSLETFGSLALTVATTNVLKNIVNRKRPYEKYNDIYPNEINEGRSFPSGHTSVAFSTATSLSLQYKKWYIVAPAFAWASAVSYSRFYLGQHYPTDVLGAAVVGAGSAWISHRATRWLQKKK